MQAGFADVARVEFDAALEIRDRGVGLFEIVQQRADVELNVGVAGHEVRNVDDVRQAAFGVAQIGLVELAQIFAGQHVIRIGGQRQLQLELGAVGGAVVEAHDAEPNVGGRELGVERHRRLQFVARVLRAIATGRRLEHVRKAQAHAIDVVLGRARRRVFLDVGQHVEVALTLRGGRIQERKRERVVGYDLERLLEIVLRRLEVARVEGFEALLERSRKPCVRIVVSLRCGSRQRHARRHERKRGEGAPHSDIHRSLMCDGEPPIHLPLSSRRTSHSGRPAASILA